MIPARFLRRVMFLEWGRGQEDNYINVYSKGALIGMCIDLIMREESNGNRGILSLMKEYWWDVNYIGL